MSLEVSFGGSLAGKRKRAASLQPFYFAWLPGTDSIPRTPTDRLINGRVESAGRTRGHYVPGQGIPIPWSMGINYLSD